jgi:hypothetical protein
VLTLKLDLWRWNFKKKIQKKQWEFRINLLEYILCIKACFMSLKHVRWLCF